MIGLLTIESDKMEAFDEEALETAVRMSNHAAVAISNAILYKQVREANQAKSEFVSMVSHELKTPHDLHARLCRSAALRHDRRTFSTAKRLPGNHRRQHSAHEPTNPRPHRHLSH
ncbi:MAG: hypothetical protein M5U34_02970 [Chloroflexi bacterium]|nr:hypothetical protein [Chloroflexota bacterium]